MKEIDDHFSKEEIKRRSKLFYGTLMVLLLPFILIPLLLSLIIRTFYPQIQIPNHPDMIGNVITLFLILFAMVVLVRLGKPTLSAILLIGIWLTAIIIMLVNGSINDNVAALLVIPIIIAGLLINGKASISIAMISTALVWTIAWFKQDAPILFLDNRFQFQPQYGHAIFWTALFWTIAGLTWILSSTIQRALRESHDQAMAFSQLSEQLEQRVAEQTLELARRANRAEALYDVSRALASTLDLLSVLNMIGEQAAHLLGFEGALVLLTDSETGEFVVEGASHAAINTFILATLQPALRHVLHSNEPQIIALGSGAAGEKTSALALPLRYGTNVEGILMLMDSRGAATRSSDDLHLAQGLADQAAIAIANTQFLEQAREAATLEERTRLARDIHDTLAQGLTGIVMQLGAVQRALAHAPGEAEVHLDLAQRMARESLAEARRSVWNMRSPALERGNIADALGNLAAHPAQPGLQVDLDVRGAPYPLETAAESALLRVSQEALVNTSKHAKATKVQIQLDYMPDAICLQICDNGIGFQNIDKVDTAPTPGVRGGFGLMGMRERLRALGGRLEITNSAGAQVRATIPRELAQPSQPNLLREANRDI